MKKAAIALVLSLVIGVAGAQEITIASDRARDIDLSKFKTFTWADQVNNELEEGGIYFLNDLVMKAQLRDAIRSELMGLGYQVDKDNPDIIVNFRLFEEQTRLKGTEGYGPEYWGDTPYTQISDTTSYLVEPGTLLISLVDKNKGRVVWHGFASGLIENDKFIKDESKLRQAVNLIFDEYGLRAKEYSRK